MYTHEYKSVCVGTEFQDSLYTVMVNVETNPSQPNHFSVPSVTVLASSTSDKTWKNMFWHTICAKMNYKYNFKMNLLIN